MKKTKRFLAMLLTLIFCMGDIGSTGVSVLAAGDEDEVVAKESSLNGVTEYKIWVGSTRVTSDNEDNIQGVTGTGTVKASYDPATKTLTLDNVTGVSGVYKNSCIYCEEDELIISGKADIVGGANYGIYAKKLTIDGEISVSLTSSDSTAAVFCDTELIINSETAKLKAESRGNSAGFAAAVNTEKLIMTEGLLEAELSTSGTDYDSNSCWWYGISATEAIISGGEIHAGSADGLGGEKLLIQGGKQTFTGENGSGIYMTLYGGENVILEVNGGELTAKGKVAGISLYGATDTLNINAGRVTAEGEKYGICIDNSETDADAKLAINEGNVSSNGGISGVYVKRGSGKAEVAVRGGSLEAYGNEQYGIHTQDAITIDGGNVKAKITTVPDDEHYYYGAVYAENKEINIDETKVSIISPEHAYIDTFDGRIWYKYGEGLGYNDVAKEVIIEDVTPSYTVTFNMNSHGTAIAPVKVKEGKTAEAPVAAAVEGYTFEGWYTDEACTKAYVFTTPVSSDITLYAKWKGVDRTVTFDMGGKADNITKKVENGQCVVKPEDPKATGLSFINWYQDSEFKTLFDFTAKIEADTTIYAKWEEAEVKVVKTYTVSFNANGVTAKDMPESQNVKEGESAAKPATDPSADGYAFTGWYADKECKTKYTFTEKVTADTVIYASWEKNETVEPDASSAMDNRPEISDSTEEIYLVKGQKFYIGKEWTVADSVSKKYVSIDKKGYLKAKKLPEGSDKVIIKKAGHPDITVHICQPALSDKKKTLEITETTPNPTYTLTIEKDAGIRNVFWYSAAPDVATVDQRGKVTAIAKGKAKITAYVNGSAYNCTITVKETAVAKSRTLHVNVGGSKTISVRGLKKWESADASIAEMNKKGNKVKAKKAGKTTLTASANDIGYTIVFYAEDITVTGDMVKAGKKNRYTIEGLKIAKDTKIALPGVKQDVVFKSSKPDVAFIDEEGKIVARSKGTAKLSTRINGKTITVTVKVAE